MLENHRTDVNKTRGSWKLYYLSLIVLSCGNFRFDLKVCNGCHDLMQKAKSFNDVAIVSVKGNDYRIHFLYMSKDEAINVFKKC